jgi:hypothetical protein
VLEDGRVADSVSRDLAAWQRLCNLIDDDPELWPEVRRSIEDGDDPWEQLIGGLDDAGSLAYLDVEDTGMELSDALVQLPRIFQAQPDLRAVNDVDDLDEAIAAADGVLASTGLRIVRLIDETDADAHALVVVPTDAVEAIVALADDLEHEVVTYG